jgi:ATP-dependent RNA circularization protein (DNA/RNA ligase family)
VTSRFVRFPRTPHLAWLGRSPVRGEKVLDETERLSFLNRQVIVEEKIDGANIGITVGPGGEVRAQNRGEYLGPGAHPQFEPLWPWIDARRSALCDALGDRLVLFGEWCFAVHSVRYDALPDWFIATDVYDRASERFWSVTRRDALSESIGIATVPLIQTGRVNFDELQHLLRTTTTRFGHELVEGLYLRVDSSHWLEARAKLVRPEFVQQIAVHWSNAPMERNRLSAAKHVKGGNRAQSFQR